MFCCIIWKLSRYMLEFRDMNVMTCFYLWVGTTAYLQNEVLFRRRPLCWFCSSRDPGCWDLEYDRISTLAAWSPAQKLWNVKLDGDARSFAKHCGLSVVAAVTLMYVLHRWSSKLRLHTQRLNHLIHWDIATQQMPHVRLFQGFGDVLWFGAQFGPSRDLRMCLGTPAIWGASRKSHTWRSHRNILTTDNGPIFTPQCQPINHPCFFFWGLIGEVSAGSLTWNLTLPLAEISAPSRSPGKQIIYIWCSQLASNRMKKIAQKTSNI